MNVRGERTRCHPLKKETRKMEATSSSAPLAEAMTAVAEPPKKQERRGRPIIRPLKCPLCGKPASRKYGKPIASLSPEAQAAVRERQRTLARRRRERLLATAATTPLLPMPPTLLVPQSTP
jgi:hypothetical protein